jgi:hypothetical protein
MSRAFVNEDSDQGGGRRHFTLPARDDPQYDEAAAEALLDAAHSGETGSAEQATGYYWGEPRLRPYVTRILARARQDRDDRLVQLAERFLA